MFESILALISNFCRANINNGNPWIWHGEVGCDKGGGCCHCNINDDSANDEVNDDNNGGGEGGAVVGRKGDAAATINAGCSILIRVRVLYLGCSGY